MTATSDIKFNFIAKDGFTYPVTVKFDDRLPCVIIVGMGREFEVAFRDRASMALHEVLPRTRINVYVDSTSTEPKYPHKYTEPQLARLRALHASGAHLADQLFAIAQAGE